MNESHLLFRITKIEVIKDKKRIMPSAVVTIFCRLAASSLNSARYFIIPTPIAPEAMIESMEVIF
jgi:hypothetical protein